MAFMLLCFVGNAMAALAPSAGMFTVARFISGMPHGAFFGTATIAARAMADKGQEGRAVAVMVLGQTLANTLGVPFGTLLAGMVSWRAAFVFVAIWALCSLLLIWRLVPQIEAVADARPGRTVPLPGQARPLDRAGCGLPGQYGDLLLVELRLSLARDRRRLERRDAARPFWCWPAWA